MRRIKLFTLVIFVASILQVNAQKSETKLLNLVRHSPGGTYGNENLIGQVNRKGFLSNPYSEWFEKNYKDYQPNADIIKKTKPILNNLEISVFMGTWCTDSQLETPRLYRILDDLKFTEGKIKVFALGITPEEFKKCPNGEEIGENIIRTPTIILKRNGNEIGRIIEYPVKSLEEDMFDILSNNIY